MNLSVGIIGLPNVGKSTLFNALLKKQQALVANYPFATIEPNVGVVGVPDERLLRLAEIEKEEHKMASLPPQIPAVVRFVDIAGLVAGASKGEGLGNKFLSHIREVDAIVHVIRDFSDENIVRAGAVNPKSDYQVIETELMLADLETVEKIKEKTRGVNNTIEKMLKALREGKPARLVSLSDKEMLEIKQWQLLTAKPVIPVLNVDEAELANYEAKIKNYADWDCVVISAKLESELAGLSEEEQKAYLKDLGIEKSGLELLIQKAFSILGLQTYLTAGEKEVRAWMIKRGDKAPQAAGVIHTDFEKGFIKAKIVSYQDFVALGGWKGATKAGKVRLEGKDYVMHEGDVVEFMFSL